MRLAMEAARGVDDDDIRLARARGGDRVEDDRARIGAGLLLDEVRAGALRPHTELLDGRRTKGVARSEHDLPALVGETTRQLSDRRGLARAVDADDEQYERLLSG